MSANFKAYIRTLLKRIPTLEVQQNSGYVYTIIVDSRVLQERVVGGTVADKIDRLLNKSSKVKKISLWANIDCFMRKSLQVEMKA